MADEDTLWEKIVVADPSPSVPLGLSLVKALNKWVRKEAFLRGRAAEEYDAAVNAFVERLRAGVDVAPLWPPLVAQVERSMPPAEDGRPRGLYFVVVVTPEQEEGMETLAEPYMEGCRLVVSPFGDRSTYGRTSRVLQRLMEVPPPPPKPPATAYDILLDDLGARVAPWPSQPFSP